MFRNTFITFLLGWTIWFWIDKPPHENRGLPKIDDSLIENFQVAFNILKAGYLEVSFVYIWNAHYIILSLLGGALLSIGIEAMSNILSRRRMRQLIFPASLFKTRTKKAGDPKQSETTSKPSSSALPPAD